MIPEKILQQIQKMQNLHEGALKVGNIEEAATAMAMISNLLLKYNLDMATVANYKPVEKEDVIHERRNLNDYQTYHDGDFAYNLIRALSKFNYCRIVRNRMAIDRVAKDQGDFTIVGQKHNVQVVLYMYDYCLNNIKILAADGWKVYDKVDTKIKTVFVRHFFDGAVKAIAYRLQIQKEKAEEQNKTAIYAMVKYNDKAVDEKLCQLFTRLKHVTSKSQRNTGASRMGCEAGTGLNLAAGLTGSDTKKLK